MQSRMDDQFAKKRRGRGCCVIVSDHKDECWFLVRHAEPWRQEGTMTGNIFFHPQKHDVLLYNSILGEIRIHAGSKWERELYLQCFGLYLFNDENFFLNENKYTLQPLLDNGPSALSTQGVEESIEWIRMKEIEIDRGDQIEIRKAKGSDLFASYEKRNFQLSENLTLLRAVFNVKFQDSKRPRSVTIQPKNKAKYDRDYDNGIIEKWLKLRDFIDEGTTNDDTEKSMADTGTVAIA